jgi:hypothetical protein
MQVQQLADAIKIENLQTELDELNQQLLKRYR